MGAVPPGDPAILVMAARSGTANLCPVAEPSPVTPEPQAVLAPLTALLVMQATVNHTVKSAVQRVASVAQLDADRDLIQRNVLKAEFWHRVRLLRAEPAGQQPRPGQMTERGRGMVAPGRDDGPQQG